MGGGASTAGVKLDANGKPIFRSDMKPSRSNREKVELDLWGSDDGWFTDSFDSEEDESKAEAAAAEDIAAIAEEMAAGGLETHTLMPYSLIDVIKSPRMTSKRGPSSMSMYEGCADDFLDHQCYRIDLSAPNNWPEKTLCALCRKGREEYAQQALWPCGHKCACDDCVDTHALGKGSECPVCSRRVECVTDGSDGAKALKKYLDWRTLKTSSKLPEGFKAKWGMNKKLNEMDAGGTAVDRSSLGWQQQLASRGGSKLDSVNARILAERAKREANGSSSSTSASHCTPQQYFGKQEQSFVFKKDVSDQDILNKLGAVFPPGSQVQYAGNGQRTGGGEWGEGGGDAATVIKQLGIGADGQCHYLIGINATGEQVRVHHGQLTIAGVAAQIAAAAARAIEGHAAAVEKTELAPAPAADAELASSTTAATTGGYEIDVGSSSLRGGGGAIEEMRIAEDGVAYTRGQFVDFYGGVVEWEAATRCDK